MPKNYFTANDDLFISLLQKAIDGKATPEEEKQVKVALQAFVWKPMSEHKKNINIIKKQIQAASSSTDFPVNLTNAFNVITETAYYDMGWEAAYQDVPRDATKDFWEIATNKNGVTFRKMKEGQRIRVDEISGETLLAYVDYYGGALGFTDRMIRFRQLAIMFDRAKAFRDSFYLNKANNHYYLLSVAAALHVLAWQAGATVIARDIATLNLAQATLGNRNKDKGYGNSAQMPFLLYASPFDESRIEAAYRVTNADLVQGGQGQPAISGRPVRRIYTYNQFITRNHPIMILPGQKIQKNEALAPTNYTAPEDVLTLNRTQSVWSIYGAAIADTEQCLQVNLE